MKENGKKFLDDYFVFLKNSNEFAFTQPVNNCLFSCFLEKAYSKKNGSFADIKGSYKSQAFEALTGFKAFEISTNKLNNSIFDYFYKNLRKDIYFHVVQKLMHFQ